LSTPRAKLAERQAVVLQLEAFGPGRPKADVARAGEVPLWLVDCDKPVDAVDLSPAERDRVRRFATFELQRRYESGQQRMRGQLARYTKQRPSEYPTLLRELGEAIPDVERGSDDPSSL
jgi:hypothetical protein